MLPLPCRPPAARPETVAGRSFRTVEPRALFLSSTGCREGVEIFFTPRGRADSMVRGRFEGHFSGFHPTAVEPTASATKDFLNQMDKKITNVLPLDMHGYDGFILSRFFKWLRTAHMPRQGSALRAVHDFDTIPVGE